MEKNIIEMVASLFFQRPSEERQTMNGGINLAMDDGKKPHCDETSGANFRSINAGLL